MDEDRRVVDQLRLWRDDLLNITRRNNLLNFNHLAVGSLEITEPSPEAVQSRLDLPRFAGWVFQSTATDDDDGEHGVTEIVVKRAAPPDSTPNEGRNSSPDGLTTSKSSVRELIKSLRTLHRTSTQEFLDKGIWILYLGLGMLEWRDPADDQLIRSPLLLIPVRLDRPSPRELFRLVLAEGDAVVNPALALKLESDFGIALPEFDPEASVTEVFATFAKLIEEQPSWKVVPRTVLARFSFEKEVIYQDLRKNEERISAHPLIAALATPPNMKPGGIFSFDVVPEHELDDAVPPEDNPTILDADATQRQCIDAAVRGATFIMDGPPGTGKSQTIANVIGELLRAGKRVLFVSEKAAALDVVQKRLKQAGLDEFLLSLHDQRVTRKDVAVSLAHSLMQQPQVRSTVSSTELEVLRSRRRELSGYAAAMNEVRYPLGRTLHEAVGRSGALHDLPQAPVAEAVGAHVSASQFSEIIDLAHHLARAWGPVERGDAFVWRDLDGVEGTAASRHQLEGELSQVERRLDSLATCSTELAAALAIPIPATFHDVQQVLRLHTIMAQRTVVPTAWLTAAGLDAIEQLIDRLRALCADHAEAREALHQLLGERWPGVVESDLAGAVAAIAPLGELLAATRALDGSSHDDLVAVERLCRELRTLAPQLLEVAQRVAERSGNADAPLSMNRVEQLVELGRLASATHRPLRSWLNPAISGALDEARLVLRRACEAVSAARTPLTSIFEDTVLELELEGLTMRFATVHRGAGKLRKSYRDDKALLVPNLKARRLTEEALSTLEAARNWQRQAQELLRAEKRHAALLGLYYEGLETDFDAIDEAVEVARGAFAIVGGEIEHPRVIAALLEPDAAVVGDVQRLEQLRRRFLEFADQSPTGILAVFSRLSLAEFAGLAEDAIPLLAGLTSCLSQLDAIAARRVTVGELRIVAELVARFEQARLALDGRLSVDQVLLGGDYQGVDTDWDRLNTSFQWATSVRQLLAGPVGPAQAEALLTTPATPESLREALDAWDSARETLLAHFAGEHSQRLRARLIGSFDDARLLVTQLSRTLDDIAEWATYTAAVDALIAAGMIEQVSYCINTKVPAISVPGILERSVLEGFTDATFQRDTRFQLRRAIDRDAIVEEFRRLDQRLFELASARIVQSCNHDRPRPGPGQAAVISREAEKQRRHMPIRDLLAASADVAQRLKPCFLMSPLTVSQFLNPELEFDAVIIDEASQMRPCDAINAIYRAKQLIVAGDQRQLPPTSFFDGASTDETDEYEEGQFEEFQSILDLCKGQGDFPSLPLSWHYRSRHESLITFSNYSFYDGRLVTFPSAAPDSDDSGVALFKVDGIYRRGGARDNPIEADAVVDRVLEHARRHSSLSLGVVAFSEAQAAAIGTALDRRRKNLPELDYYFAEDRLNGFFVKSLESVQGDERDIIIFSVGYGRDELGKFHLSFGPLNKPGGERRLNVAITRARQRVEIVSSVSAGDFINDSTNPGVRHLRRYLDFAERGIAALGLELGPEGRDTESPFEEEVARLLRGWGYDVVPQVGQSGYRIDLGVRDSQARGGFLLGVECDGNAYHSSKVARDRDRLRHEQLESQGWTIHHIWGSAWYHEREGAEQKLRDALEAAHANGGLRSMASVAASAAPIEVEFQPTPVEAQPRWTVPYAVTEMNFRPGNFEITSPNARPALQSAIKQVVATEGPIHKDVLIRRVREAWGVGRVGSRIRESFDEVLDALARTNEIHLDGSGFIRLPDHRLRVVRVPVEGRAETERPVEYVALTEIAQAVLEVVHETHGIDQDELTRYIARIFGWRRTGDGISSRISTAIERLISNNQIERVGEQLRYLGGESR